MRAVDGKQEINLEWPNTTILFGSYDGLPGIGISDTIEWPQGMLYRFEYSLVQLYTCV